jgi:heptosyltransferase-1
MKISALMVSQVPGPIVPRAFSIEEAYNLVAHAAVPIGVYTGLTHLSAVLGKFTVEIYWDSLRWKTEGYWSEAIQNVGDYHSSPSLHSVAEAINLINPQI